MGAKRVFGGVSRAVYEEKVCQWLSNEEKLGAIYGHNSGILK